MENRSKIKRIYFILIVLLVLIGGWIFVRFVLGGSEDSWIKDSRGVWIKHGAPSETPDYVLKQQEVIDCALEKFADFTEELNSQCLGVCGDYAVDIVHVPRTAEDDLAENQCEDYRSGIVSNFIELNSGGEVVRIV